MAPSKPAEDLPAPKEKKKPPSRGGGDSRAFPCPDCQRPFSRKEYVERHRRLKHLGSRPFACESCGNSFARSDLLRRHHKTCKGPVGAAATARSNTEDGEEEDDELLDDIQRQGPIASLFGKSAGSSSSLLETQLAFPSTTLAYPASNSPIPILSPDASTSDTGSGNSPRTPAYASTATTSERGYGFVGRSADQTLALAPEPLRDADRFTQDEILASEVLEDLLRSPSSYNGGPHASYPPLTPPLSLPWHGARAPQDGPGNESSAVVSSSATGELSNGWSFGGEPAEGEGIEFSNAALELADYFNKGGVGGITALDLGFNYEPSLLPDHMFEPQVLHPQDKQFFLPTQKFCLGYLYPWHVPPIAKLSHFAAVAADSFLPSVPILHRGTMMLADLPNHTAFALTVTGAAYEPDGEQFANEMLVEKRVFLVRMFNKDGTTEEDKFASLQSMLLYQLLGLFHREESQRLLAHTFHGALVMMLRQLSLPSKIQQAYLVEPHPGLEGDVLDAVWKQWVKVETWRRVAFIVFLSDLETSTRFETAPLLPFSELAIDLPASDLLWNADSAASWLALRLDPSTPQTVPFLEAIRGLLAPQAGAGANRAWPTPGDVGGPTTVAQKLGRLGALPLLILARTLSFLQMKTEEAIATVDPFRNIYDVVGLFENREKEHRDVLARIVRGREVLRALPGGVRRGGGEKWFENVMPTAARGPGRGKGNTDGQELSESAAYQIKLNEDKGQFERHIHRAKQTLQTELPDFFIDASSGAAVADRAAWSG